jgi:hypothetical protein
MLTGWGGNCLHDTAGLHIPGDYVRIIRKGMTGFDGANRSRAASRGALPSQIQSKNTNANNGKNAFTFPFARTNAMALAA